MRTTVWTRLVAGTALSLLLCLPALSQSRGPVMTTQGPSTTAGAASGEGRDRDALRDFLHCLRVLNLTEAQVTAILQFINGEKPTLQTLHDTIKADRQTLHNDASASPPDPCKVGNDFLVVRSDRLAIDAELEKIRTFIESQLTEDQKARFDGCIKGTAAATAG
jgi:hypothetical protein